MPGLLRSALAGLVIALLGCGPGAAGPESRVADNVIVVPDAKAKVVTVWMVVNAGCRDEAGGQCRGVAHYLEHLVFLGRSPNQDASSARVFSAGNTNASTSMLATSYYQSAPVREGAVLEDLDKIFKFYSERLQNIDVAEDAALRERNVVLQEFNFRRTDSIRSKFYQEMNAKLQPDHPISQSVIGSRTDIDGFNLEKARAFHQRWYAKNNITFIVYGPVSEADVKALATKYVEPLPVRKVPQRGWLDARRTFAPMDETLRVRDPESTRTQVLLERIVRFEDPDPAATGASNAILFDYLNGQIKGSLTDVFVEQRKLASQVSVSTTPLGAGVLWYSVSATLEDGTTPEAMKAAIEDYFRELPKAGVEVSVVERLKRRRANDLAEVAKEPQRTLSALTNWLGGIRTYADWQKRGEMLAAVKSQTMQPVLEAMAGQGRQMFGVLSPPEMKK